MCVCAESQDSLYSGRCVILGPLTLQMSTRELILKSLPVTSNYIVIFLFKKALLFQVGMYFLNNNHCLLYKILLYFTVSELFVINVHIGIL